MENRMFCYQCEQTANGTGCTGLSGVCGKLADTAKYQDKLTGALITLSKCVYYNKSLRTEYTDKLIMKGLFATVTNVNFDGDAIMTLTRYVHRESDRICDGHNMIKDFDINRIWQEEADIKSLKSLLLFGIRGMAAYAYHAAVLGYTSDKVNQFFYKALRLIGSNSDMDTLFSAVIEAGRVNYTCMEMLEIANTNTYGIPVPTKVSMTIEAGPFIVVTGHDLFDLRKLLEETRGTNVKVYSHGEMLPAHAYPELKKFRNFCGNFGTAWQNQKKEFENIPAPVLFTTNCIMPPRPSYYDRVYTKGVVHFPGTQHVGDKEGFRKIINRAIELGGYKEERKMTGINGGETIITGWSHHSILEHIDELTEKIKNREIKHIFLVGGCDGAKPGRNYFTDFVKNTPEDSIVLTLACGKYRFNDLDMGTIDGIPRLMDMGQCNDAFGAIKVVLELAKRFRCGINELPLSIVLSWYEQKAVSVLLTLLAMGFKNILLGPTLPACLSDNILYLLESRFGIAQTTTVEEDLNKLVGNRRKKEACLFYPNSFACLTCGRI